MALKGNLETVSLPDVFQILARQGQAGLLQISASERTHYVELERGRICAVSGSGGGAKLGDLLVHHGHLTEGNLEKALNMQKTRNIKLGQLLVDNKFCAQDLIEETVRFQVQEEICDLFMIKSAEFEFFAGTMLDEKLAMGGKFVKLNINPDSVLLEAARRMDEWATIETKIPSGATLFTVTEIGRDYFQSADRSTQVVLTLINDLRTFESIVAKSCMGRFRTGSIISQMLDAGAVQHLAFELYPQIAEKHMNDHRFREAALIYRYAIDYIQDPVVRESMFKNLQIADQRVQELESGGLEMQPSEIVRSPKLSGAGGGSKLKLILGAVAAVLLLAGAGVAWKLLIPAGVDESAFDDTPFETNAPRVEQMLNQEQWLEARELLVSITPKKTANKPPYEKLQDRLLADASAAARSALDELKKIDPHESLSDAQRYIERGRKLVKSYPETLGLKTAVTEEIKKLDFALDGWSKKLQTEESEALLNNLQGELATRSTDDTLKFIALARHKSLVPAVETEFQVLETQIKLLRSNEAAALERFQAQQAAHHDMEAQAEAQFLLQLQKASGFGPTPEYNQLMQLTEGSVETLGAQAQAAQTAFEAATARPGLVQRTAAAELQALLKKFPASLQSGRIEKLLAAIEQYGQ